MIGALGLVILLLLGACSPGGEDEIAGQKSKLDVVCTTGMVADLVRNIGGDRVAVEGLMGPGVDPHYYKASQGDIKKLTRADLICFNGLFLEGKMEDIFGRMGRKKKVVPVSWDIPEERLRRPPEFEGNYDPHIWFDVSLWQRTIDVVASALVALDPAGAAPYRKNAAAYRARLDTLHQWVLQQVDQIPPAQRVLVTAHDAFGYFGQAYGMEVVGLQGISTVAEYGINDVNQLVDLIVARSLKAIFVESSVPQRSINAVREGCRARGLEVRIGGTLYSDAMGESGSGADTYIGMVRSNVNTMVAALR